MHSKGLVHSLHCIVWGWYSTEYTSDCSVTTQNCNESILLQRTSFPHYCIGSEVQSQRVSKKLTSTVALQRAQSAQETMICSCWYCVYTINPGAHCIALKYTSHITANCGQSKKLERSSHDKGRGTCDFIVYITVFPHTHNLSNCKRKSSREIISNFEM